jgi:lysophospholipase L1-like esterase
VSGRRFALRALASLLGLVLAILLTEAIARGSAHLGTDAGRRIASRDPLKVIYEPYGDYGYRASPGKIERYYNGTRAVFNSMGYRGPLVSIEKPKGTYRIILLGGSTTFGYGVDDNATIDEYMRRLLRERWRYGCFEVVNLALGGYDSYQDYERMRVDGTKLTPDLVVINSGINDVRNAQYPELSYPPDPRTLIWESAMRRMRDESKHGRSLWTLALHYSYLARLPAYAVELWGQRQGLHAIQVAEAHGSAVDYFEINVVRTTELALKAGAAVILSIPPSALSTRHKPSDPPEKSYWIKDAGTTEAYRRRLGARMAEIARRQSASGQRVSSVSHGLPPEQFLDDAHLTSVGNETVARNLVEAAIPYLRAALPRTNDGEPHCLRS